MQYVKKNTVIIGQFNTIRPKLHDAQISVVVFEAKKEYNTVVIKLCQGGYYVMANEKKTNQPDNMDKPLFTGDALRDMNVSEGEKAAEASEAIFNAVKDKVKKK